MQSLLILTQVSLVFGQSGETARLFGGHCSDDSQVHQRGSPRCHSEENLSDFFPS